MIHPTLQRGQVSGCAAQANLLFVVCPDRGRDPDPAASGPLPAGSGNRPIGAAGGGTWGVIPNGSWRSAKLLETYTQTYTRFVKNCIIRSSSSLQDNGGGV